MGFAADSCREALKRCYGDVQQAINMLESCGGALSSLQQLTQGIDYLVSYKSVIWEISLARYFKYFLLMCSITDYL